MTKFLIKNLLTLYNNITKISTIIKNIFNIKNILQILKKIKTKNLSKLTFL